MLQITVDLKDVNAIEAALDKLIESVRDADTLQGLLDEEEQFQPAFGPPGDGFETFSSGETVITNLTAESQDYQEERTPTSEWIFFRQAVKHRALHEKILQYVQAVKHINRADEVLWRDSETHAAEDAIEALALHDKRYITDFIAFLKTNDLEHEVYQSDAIARMIDKFGWCPETLELLAARLTVCRGQGADYDLEYYINDQDLAGALAESAEFDRFFEYLIAHSRTMGLMDVWHVGKIIDAIPDVGKTDSARIQCYRRYPDEHCCRPLKQADPDDPDALYVQANLSAFQQDDPAEAMRYFKRFLDVAMPEPADLEPIYDWACRTANQQRNQKNTLLAQELYEFAATLGVGSAEALYKAGRLVAYQEEYKTAIEYYDRALKVDPEYFDALNWKGDALRHLDRYDESMAVYRDLIKKSGDSGHLYSVGHLLEEQEKYDEAIEAYEQNKAGGDRRANSGLARCYAAQKQYDQAVKYYKKELAKSPDLFPTWRSLGLVYRDMGEDQKALDAFEKGINKARSAKWAKPPYKNAAGLYFDLGWTHECQKRIDQAMDAYHKSIECNSSWEACHNLGRLLIVGDKNESAIGIIEPRIAIQDEARLRNLLAVAFINKKEMQAGQKHLERAIELDPDNLAFYTNLACLCALEGKSDEALKWLSEAFGRGFDNFESIDSDTDLDSIRETDGFKSLMKKYRPD